MFILRKIIDRGVNVPEPVRMPADPDTTYKAGCALNLKSGVTANCGASEAATYIALENASKKDTVLCFKVNSDMVFEAPVSEDTSALNVGDKVILDVEDGIALGVTATTSGGVAEVVEKTGGSTLYIKF